MPKPLRVLRKEKTRNSAMATRNEIDQLNQTNSRVMKHAIECLEERLQYYSAGNPPIHRPTARRLINDTWDRYVLAFNANWGLKTWFLPGEHRYEDMEKLYEQCMSIVEKEVEAPTKPDSVQTNTNDLTNWTCFEELQREVDPQLKFRLACDHLPGNNRSPIKQACNKCNDFKSLETEWYNRWIALSMATTEESAKTLVKETRAFLYAFKMMGQDYSQTTLMYRQFRDKLPEGVQSAWDSKLNELGDGKCSSTLEQCLQFTENFKY